MDSGDRTATAHTALPKARAPRIAIEDVYPELDCGRYPVKREVGDRIDVWADIFSEGHGVLRAAIRYAAPGAASWQRAPMTLYDNDRWHGGFEVDTVGRWRFTIESWPDRFGSWAADLVKKRDAGQAIALELREGRELVEAASRRARGPLRQQLSALLARLDDRGLDDGEPERQLAVLLDPALREALAGLPERERVVRYEHTLEITVDRV
ncbi:MAG: DUF3416 domain-containing protein, partial [Alphaproteobacteria bacterium]|nr:DUF3416 domain-containing protein [Alphaproteobacteria bacterium]